MRAFFFLLYGLVFGLASCDQDMEPYPDIPVWNESRMVNVALTSDTVYFEVVKEKAVTYYQWIVERDGIIINDKIDLKETGNSITVSFPNAYKEVYLVRCRQRSENTLWSKWAKWVVVVKSI